MSNTYLKKEPMISANDALKLTNFYKSMHNYNLEMIVSAAQKGKTHCIVDLGRNLTEEQVKHMVDEYENSGYHIIRTWTSKDADDWRPEEEIPTDYNATISWE